VLIDVLESALDTGYACLHMLTLTPAAAALCFLEHGYLPCTMGCARKDRIKRSRGTRWVAMVLKAMKVAKRHSAAKKVHTAKSEVMQKNKAKAHKVKQRPEKMDVVTQEEHEKEQEEKHQEEEEGGMSGG